MLEAKGLGSTRGPVYRSRGVVLTAIFLLGRRRTEGGRASIEIPTSHALTMASEFTCHRCMQLLRLGTRAQASSRKNCLSNRLAHRRHGLSSTTLFRPPGPQRQRRSPIQSTRFASSSTAQGEAIKNESTETPPEKPQIRPLLRPNNLFHSFSKSPSSDIRRRAALIKQDAFCPHPSHQQTRVAVSPNDSEARKTGDEAAEAPAHSNFECPDCGVPIYCSEGHWMDDFEAHLEVCETIRQINEDDHDLRSGRFFREFDYPGLQPDEFVVNMTNWDTFLYTREFDAINDDRCMRQVTRLLTYPVTVASVLHELSPYDIRNERLTAEGLKSLSG